MPDASAHVGRSYRPSTSVQDQTFQTPILRAKRGFCGRSVGANWRRMLPHESSSLAIDSIRDNRPTLRYLSHSYDTFGTRSRCSRKALPFPSGARSTTPERKGKGQHGPVKRPYIHRSTRDDSTSCVRVVWVVKNRRWKPPEEARHVLHRRSSPRPGSKDMARGAYRTLLFAALVALLVSLVAGAVMPVRDAWEPRNARPPKSRTSWRTCEETPGLVELVEET